MSLRPGDTAFAQGRKVAVHSQNGEAALVMTSGGDAPKERVQLSELRCVRSPPAKPYPPPPGPPHASRNAILHPVRSTASFPSFAATPAPSSAAASSSPAFTPNMPIERLIDGLWFPCEVRSFDVATGMMDIWHEETQTFESKVPVEEVQVYRKGRGEQIDAAGAASGISPAPSCTSN